MNGLSLFTGGGIGELAFKHIFPDYQTVGYVEWDKYCQSVIRARIADGVLDDAPIFGDIRHFNAAYASLYAGKVDWLSGGFPCQPFSVAGRQLGEADERNMWPATRDAIRIIRPRYVFLENVSGLLVHQYIQRIFGDLAEMRYDCEWDIVGASDVGAPHRRKRLWIVPYTDSINSGIWNEKTQRGYECCQEWSSIDISKVVDIAGYRMRSITGDCRKDDGLSDPLDRLKALGNGWVPQVVRRVLEVNTK